MTRLFFRVRETVRLSCRRPAASLFPKEASRRISILLGYEHRKLSSGKRRAEGCFIGFTQPEGVTGASRVARIFPVEKDLRISGLFLGLAFVFAFFDFLIEIEGHQICDCLCLFTLTGGTDLVGIIVRVWQRKGFETPSAQGTGPYFCVVHRFHILSFLFLLLFARINYWARFYKWKNVFFGKKSVPIRPGAKSGSYP